MRNKRRASAPSQAASAAAAEIPSRRGGPRTPEGKAKSALNNLRHGLTGDFRIIDHEPQHKFDALVAALREEHQPATATEELLLQRMAEHYWLSRRARQLQDTALLASSSRRFALMLRYQTTNDHGFHKCLTELMKLKKQRLQAQQEFESQSAPAPAHFQPQKAKAAANGSFATPLSALNYWFPGDSLAIDPNLSDPFKHSIAPFRLAVRKKKGD